MFPLLAPVAVALSAALYTLADSPNPQPSAPATQNYYFPQYTCVPSTDYYAWGVNFFDSSPNQNFVACRSVTANCRYQSDGSTGLCPDAPTPWGSVQTCGFYLCPKYASNGLPLDYFNWMRGSGGTICFYGYSDNPDAVHCGYNSNGDAVEVVGNITCAPALPSCSVSRRRYRREDNLTAMLRKTAKAGEVIRVSDSGKS
uniref:Uncharacterized protein n=1 Tax=Mycena chlorophos TaxID=658473 RepID=A0ABQ0LML7_MYCCL|nr:predicted protein [Mycena chlorophos]